VRPVAASNTDRPGVERRYGSRPQRILVVDDYRDVRDLWICWLSQWGFQVDEAQNGLEAVQCATAAPPALILMDISMPVMDGWRATEILKASPQTAHVPVVAVTALGSVEDYAARAAAAGCDALVSKPCELADLLRHIRNVLGRSRDRLGRSVVAAVDLPLA
jgi:two-component system, cell cycle response regulator DivK